MDRGEGWRGFIIGRFVESGVKGGVEGKRGSPGARRVCVCLSVKKTLDRGACNRPTHSTHMHARRNTAPVQLENVDAALKRSTR